MVANQSPIGVRPGIANPARRKIKAQPFRTRVRLIVPRRGVHMSDREKAGLRGPVRTCIRESIVPDESSGLATTEYSFDGRFLSSRFGGPDGSEWITTHTYDNHGRLTKITSGKSGEIAKETLYAYDDAGRSLSITNTENGDRTDFTYDEQGRKKAIKRFDPKTLQRLKNSGHTGSAWDAALSGIDVPVGGTVTTMYDENDRAVELQVRDSGDQLESRVVRKYNAAGLTSEETPILENPALMFINRVPFEQRGQPPPERLEMLGRAMSAIRGGKAQAGTEHTYDAQGRATKIRERNGLFEKIITITYNDHGDKSEESTTFTDNCVVPVGVPCSVDDEGNLIPSKSITGDAGVFHLSEHNSEVHYTYQYDSRGNWTQQTANGSGPSVLPHFVCHRRLTYY